jgi:hypothetical protein
MAEPLVRYTLPTRYDDAPYGSICIIKGGKEDRYYIQTSDQHNTWIEIGVFLTKVFSTHLQDEKFMKKCLEDYKNM